MKEKNGFKSDTYFALLHLALITTNQRICKSQPEKTQQTFFSSKTVQHINRRQEEDLPPEGALPLGNALQNGSTDVRLLHRVAAAHQREAIRGVAVHQRLKSGLLGCGTI